VATTGETATQSRMEQSVEIGGALLQPFQGGSDANALIDASYLWASGSRPWLLGVGFRSSQQAACAACAGWLPRTNSAPWAARVWWPPLSEGSSPGDSGEAAALVLAIQEFVVSGGGGRGRRRQSAASPGRTGSRGRVGQRGCWRSGAGATSRRVELPQSSADAALWLRWADCWSSSLYEGGLLVKPCVRPLTPWVPSCRVSAVLSSA
jgi:hypothetical protein